MLSSGSDVGKTCHQRGREREGGTEGGRKRVKREGGRDSRKEGGKKGKGRGRKNKDGGGEEKVGRKEGMEG